MGGTLTHWSDRGTAFLGRRITWLSSMYRCGLSGILELGAAGGKRQNIFRTDKNDNAYG